MALDRQTRRGVLKSAGAAAVALAAPGCFRNPQSAVRNPQSNEPPVNDTVIDIHVHAAAATAPGCKISSRMRGKFNWLVRLGFYEDVTIRKLKEDFDGTISGHLVKVVQRAVDVHKAVLLAMDGVYTAGAPDIDRTQYMVANRYVQRLARDHGDAGVLFGASINPTRTDAVDELKRCTGELPWGDDGDDEAGPAPALVKWLPNAQEFDPSACPEAFYDALVERKIPLLCHGGKEHAVPTRSAFQKMGNPALLRRALERGVTVIVAHCASMVNLLDWKHHYVGALAEMFVEAKDRGWALYADVSALSPMFRSGFAMRDIMSRLVEPHGERLVLGSDYPLPPGRVRGVANPLDRNYRWLLDRGLPPSIGTAGAKLLNPKAMG